MVPDQEWDLDQITVLVLVQDLDFQWARMVHIQAICPALLMVTCLGHQGHLKARTFILTLILDHRLVEEGYLKVHPQ